MPFLKGKKIEEELTAVLNAVEGVGGLEFQKNVKELVREMRKANNLLDSLELCLADIYQ